jgi:mannose-6-phosphate isomerase-like protein (cupin superfamily)
MEKLVYTGEGYKTVLMAGAWRVAFLRHADRFAALQGFERHNETHECFILLSGEGTMHIRDAEGHVESTVMEINVIYDVLPGEWHNITVSEDATVLIVENADTSAANSDKCTLEGEML